MKLRTLTATAYLLLLSAPTWAQTNRTDAETLDRLSQERLEGGAFRNHGSPPPQSSIPQERLRQPAGIWTCMGTPEQQPIYSAPSAGASEIGVTGGRIAAGRDQGSFTSVLFREGVIGYVPKSSVRAYRNQFNPSAICSFVGLRPNGTVVFSTR